MSDLDAILQEARQLGEKLSQHPRIKEFQAAAKAVAEDREAQEVLRAYQDAVDRIASLESSGKPVEPEDKRKAADAQRQAAGNAKIKEMMKQQANYLELMHRVSAAIEEASQSAEHP
jgi:cell fate (sporulation/competence/biofilm development) regulator YlbF (YheA/YmcA/DUF963 family)